MPTLTCPFCGTMDAGTGNFCQVCGKPVRGTRPGFTQSPVIAGDPEESGSRQRQVLILLAGAIVLLLAAVLGIVIMRGRNVQRLADRQIPALPPGQTLSAREIAQRSFPAVVLLLVENEKGEPIGLGSGFFISSNVIATNHHVIRNASQVYAKVIGQDVRLHIEGLVAGNTDQDLALLKVEGVPSGTSVLPVIDGEHSQVGDQVYVVGNPRGLEGTFSQGIISGFRERNGVRNLQITAPISPGSSGGPVLNDRGEVIGVAVGTIEDGQNLNFAVPSSYLIALKGEMKSARPLVAAGDAGMDEIPSGETPAPEESGIPEPARLSYVEGLGFQNQKRYTEAAVSFKQAISLFPDYALAHFRLGEVYTEMKMDDEAVKSFREAVRLKPETAAIHVGLGIAYIRTRQYPDAIKTLNEAVRLSPMIAEAHYALGVAYIGAGDIEKARQEYSILKVLNASYADRLLKMMSQ